MITRYATKSGTVAEKPLTRLRQTLCWRPGSSNRLVVVSNATAKGTPRRRALDFGDAMRLFSSGPRIALGLLMGVLAACEDAPQSSVTFRLEDVWSFARGAMNREPLLVDIRGRPHGEDDAALHAAVIGAMTQAITWSADPRFTADLSATAPSSFRVVVALNGVAGLGGRAQCRGMSEGGGPLPNGRVQIVATFCDGEDVLANVRGHIARTDGVEDPRFSRLIRQVTRDMFAKSNAP